MAIGRINHRPQMDTDLPTLLRRAGRQAGSHRLPEEARSAWESVLYLCESVAV